MAPLFPDGRPLAFRLIGAKGAPAPADRVLSVDGAWGAPGLNLSHWPGNATPPALRHELSTGSALAFVALPPEERARLAPECEIVANNHYDTDGVCAMWTLRHPEEALGRRSALLDAAAAGDFFRIPSRNALAIDAIVDGLGDAERSPIARELEGLADADRHERCLHFLLESLGPMLDGEIEPYRELWQPTVEAAERDLELLASCAREDEPELDCTTWTSTRSTWQPGRHALFAASPADRALFAGPMQGGHIYRLILGTLSWFEIPGKEPSPRPDLEALAAELNRRESPRDDAHAWRTHPSSSPSPELWFGAPDAPFFVERNAALRPSRLPLAKVRGLLRAALG